MKDMNYSEEELIRLLNTLDDDVSVPLDVQAAWRKAVREVERKKNTARKWLGIASSAAALVLVGGLAFYAFGNDKKVAKQQETREAPALTFVTTYLEADGISDNGWAVVQDFDERAETVVLAEGKLEITAKSIEDSLSSLKTVIADNGGYFTEEESIKTGNAFKGTFVIPNESVQTFIREMQDNGFAQPEMEFVDVSERNDLLANRRAALKQEAENNDSYELQESIADLEMEILELEEKTRYALITVVIRAE